MKPDVNGRDLLRAGVSQGPRVAVALAAALRAKVNGKARSRDEQLAAALAAIDRA